MKFHQIFRPWLAFLKEYTKILERKLTILRAFPLFRTKAVLVIGPSQREQEVPFSPDFIILLKLFLPAHLKAFEKSKIILFWNGTASKMYLERRIKLPECVHFVFTKCDAKQLRLIKALNPHVRVFRFRSLALSTHTQQTLIVDVISIFKKLKLKKLWVTGINLRVHGYNDAYKKIYTHHSNQGNIGRSIKAGHDPLLDFNQLKDMLKHDAFTPDAALMNILSMEQTEYISLFNDNNGTRIGHEK